VSGMVYVIVNCGAALLSLFERSLHTPVAISTVSTHSVTALTVKVYVSPSTLTKLVTDQFHKVISPAVNHVTFSENCAVIWMIPVLVGSLLVVESVTLGA
jgi:hypothetical protein